MARLGDSIDPSLLRQDFSGFANAAAIRSAGLTQLGNAVGGAIKELGEEKKRLKDEHRAGADAIKAAGILLPELKPRLDLLSDELDNPDRTDREKASLGTQIREMIDLAVSEKRYGEDLNLRKRGMDLQEQGQLADIQSSNLRNQVTAYELSNAVQTQELDEATKASLGPALLDQTLAIAPEGIKSDILKDIGEYSDAQKYEMANKIRSILPPSTQAKAPALTEVSVAGGKQQVQWDPARGWVPIEVNGLVTPADASDAELEVLLPPIGENPADGMVLPPRPGFTPTPQPQISPRDQIAMEKYKDEKAAKDTAKRDSIAKSQVFLSALENLEKSPGFNNLFGTNIGTPTWVAGSDAADSKVAFEQLKAMGFLEAVKGMQGMGALSDAEGKKLDVAYLGLQTSMSEESAKKKIAEIKETLRKGIERAGSNGLVAPQQELTPEQKGLSILQGLAPR